ncbi:MAG TPA: PAS domain S-box protein [Coleofasciculaceae cyanobacterium]|jgi:PAS domain S-box-containing protein
MKESETLLQQVFHSIATGIFVVDVQSLGRGEPEAITYRFVINNPAYARMLRISQANLAGLCPHECFPPDMADKFCANYSRCLEQQQPISYEESFEIANVRCTLLTTLFPKLEPDGTISRIIGSSQDISNLRQIETLSKPFNQAIATSVETAATQLHQANQRTQVEEKEHEWSEDFLRLTQLSLDRSAIMAYLVGKQGQFLYVNNVACQLLGYSREELLTMSVADVTPDFPSEVWSEHWQEVKRRRSFSFESVKKTKDNRRFPVEITVNYFEFNDREYNCVFVRDLTDSKRAEEALSQEKELLFALIKNVPIGIITTDEIGKILLVNPAYEKICGYSEAELVGQKPPYPYWDLADLEEINKEFIKAMSGEKEHIELWFTKKNGERFLARLKPITIFDAQGNMLRHLATMEDITKYKQAEEELCNALEAERELNEIKSRFTAMVSHEYRTPLATILSSAELLERYTQKFTEEQKLNHYRRIQTSTRILAQLVNDVLTISKIEAGKQEFNPSLLDLDKFCQELIEELQPTIGNQHKLVFTSQGHWTLTDQECICITAAYMDEKLLRYIISNLLSNAIKYSSQGSTVKFDLVYDQRQAVFRIQDQGIGIPKEDLQYLFESFYRGSNVGAISGTGLGLTIVKNSVDLHGGQMAVDSEVGVGTTFTITLPLNNHVTTKEI